MNRTAPNSNGAMAVTETTDDLRAVVELLGREALALARQHLPPSAVRLQAHGVTVEVEWAATGRPALTADDVVPSGTRPGLPMPAAPDPSDTEAGSPDDSGTRGGSDGEPADAQDTFPLCAETVGVFYRAPEPGASPFVEVGSVVHPGQQVAITEAMKLMIPVEATRSGRITEIVVEDGMPVEHGQPLMWLAEQA